MCVLVFWRNNAWKSLLVIPSFFCSQLICFNSILKSIPYDEGGVLKYNEAGKFEYDDQVDDEGDDQDDKQGEEMEF